VRFPGDGQLALADELADAIADQMDADHGPVDQADDLDDAARADDLASAVAGQVVLRDGDRVAVGGTRGCLGDADGGHLGVRVGDPRDGVLRDHDGSEARDLLGHEDPC
jgi:hypothetical protein